MKVTARGIRVESVTRRSIELVAGLLLGFIRDDAPSGRSIEEARETLERLVAEPLALVEVAVCDGEAVGLMVSTFSVSAHTGRRVLRIEALYTIPTWRRRGVARALLTHAGELARKIGAQRLQLDTDVDNSAARTAYEKSEFELIRDKRVYMRFLR